MLVVERAGGGADNLKFNFVCLKHTITMLQNMSLFRDLFRQNHETGLIYDVEFLSNFPHDLCFISSQNHVFKKNNQKHNLLAIQSLFCEISVFNFVWFSNLLCLFPNSEDVLSADAGECVICLDDMEQGDTIARLPCLCIYHKR